MMRTDRIFGAILAMLILSVSCTREELPSVRRAATAQYTVSEARACYERTLAAGTRAAEAGPLTAGAWRPDWDRAAVSIGSTLYSVDVPLSSAEYRYYRYADRTSDSLLPFALPVRLVTVRNPETGGECCYLRYYLPDAAYAAAHDEADYDRLLNSRPKKGFTGRSVYVSLDGYVIAAGRYERGLLTDYAFWFDETRTEEECEADMRRLLDGLRVGRCRASQPTTRVDHPKPTENGENPKKDDKEPDPLDWGGLECVVIEGIRPEKPVIRYELPVDDFPAAVSGNSGATWGGSGGLGGEGDSSNSSDDSDGFPDNPDIKFEDPRVKDLLDSLVKDCMGRRLIRSLDGVTVLTEQDANRFDPVTNTIFLKPHDKYGYRDYVFMEELIHSYQYQRRGNGDGRFPTLNDEIDAKVGWLTYINKQIAYRAVTPGKSQLGENAEAMYWMADLLSFDVGPLSYDFTELYLLAKESLQGLQTKDRDSPFLVNCYTPERYPFQYERMSQGLDTIYKLLEDC